MGRGPVIFLPLFTRCSSTCPTLLHKLEKSLADEPPASHFRVLVFSFDPAETHASLLAFRSASGIPANWILAHADEGATRSVLQYASYSVMSRGAVFIHPSEIFVLDDSFRWRWTIEGVDWTTKDVARVIEQTSSPNFVTRIEAHPQTIAWTAMGLAIGSIVLTIAVRFRHIAARAPALRSPELPRPS